MSLGWFPLGLGLIVKDESSELIVISIIPHMVAVLYCVFIQRLTVIATCDFSFLCH